MPALDNGAQRASGGSVPVRPPYVTPTPTRNGLAYAGSIMGREIIYERSRDQVQADIDIRNPNIPRSRPR